MASFHFARMRADSREALAAADYPPRKIILIHSGVSIGLALLLSVFSYLLDMGIAQTGGLEGIGTRTVLETVQSLLQTANTILLPFWAIGYIRTVMNWTRREQANAGTLLSGFLCFGSVLRLLLLQGILYAALGIMGIYGGAAVFMMTPSAKALLILTQEMTQAGITDSYAMMESEAYWAAVEPMIPFVLVGALLVVAPVAYRLRFAEYALMDAPKQGALRAILKSWRMTRGNCLPLLKLDLHLWWYHLAGVLIMALGYDDLLLELAGIQLGISADAAMFAFYIAALLCELWLYVWKKNEVSAIYALAYDQLAVPQEAPVKPQPKNVPWNY